MQVTLEFEVTEAEYLEAAGAMRRRKGKDWYKPLRVTGMLASGVGIGSLMISPGVTGFVLAAFGLYVSVYPWVQYREQADDGWRAYAEVGPQVWETTAESLLIRSGLYEIRLPWGIIRSVVQTRNLLLIYRNQSDPMIVPKRAFRSEADLAAVLQLAGRSMGTSVRGFPVITKPNDPVSTDPTK